MGLACAFVQSGCRREPSERVVHETALDILYEEPIWRVTAPPPQRRVRANALTASFDTSVDGRERRTLSMPPPSEVVLDLPADLEGPLTLTGFAGIGARFLPERACDVEFEVETSAGRTWSTTFLVDTEQPASERTWRPFTHADVSEAAPPGIPVEPGERVTLRTRLSMRDGGPAFDETEYGRMVRVGFADLRLIRTVQKRALPSSKEQPSLVLIVMDTLRADHLSCYGYKPGTTPTLDALAERGLRFEQAYATSSWTWPSTASILTGLGWEEHGVFDEHACLLSPQIDCLAEALYERDFLTAGFACNPLISKRWRFDQGFESFQDVRSFRFGKSAVPEVLDWLDEHAGTRFFLYVHLVDAHGPYDLTDEARAAIGDPPEGYPAHAGLRESEKKLLVNQVHKANGEPDPDAVLPAEHQAWMRTEYEAAVVTADTQVGRVIERLRTLGIEDETIVVFTSDHGEALLDHGYAKHGHQLFEELVRVPLIIAGPGIPQGRTVEAIVSNRHVAPTLARLGGAELLPGVGLDLVAFAADEPKEPGTVTFATHHGLWNGWGRAPVHGIRSGPWTLHYAEQGRPWGDDPNGPLPTLPLDGTWTGEARLYNLDRDPAQRADLLLDEAERAKGLMEVLDRARARAEGRPLGTQDAAGSGTIQMLQGIGYVEGDEDADKD